MNVLPLPEDARRAIRDHSWPNLQAEDAATWDGDQAIFDRVRIMESLLANAGQELALSGQETITAATEQLHDLAAFKMRVESGTVLMDQNSAREYEQAEFNVATTVERLRSLRAQIEHAIPRCEDPMAALQSTLSRYPALRAGRSYIK